TGAAGQVEFFMRMEYSNTGQIEFADPSLDRSCRRETNRTNDLKSSEAVSIAPGRRSEGCAHVFPVRSSGTKPALFGIYPGTPGSQDVADFLPDDQPIYDFYFS